VIGGPLSAVLIFRGTPGKPVISAIANDACAPVFAGTPRKRKLPASANRPRTADNTFEISYWNSSWLSRGE
jgi:hypothetical protein